VTNGTRAMKNLRSLIALFFVTASLAAQPAPAPAPTVPADTSAPTPAPATTTPAVPANPLAPPSSPAVSITMPGSAETTTVTDANGATSNVMHKANFPNEDVRTILSSTAMLFNLNVIIPDTLTGTATIQLHDVTWQQIFHYVLDPLGYTYVVDGTGPNAVIQIKNKTDIASEPMETRVIKVNSATAADLAKSLTVFLDSTSKPPETIIPDARTNFLIVTARPSRMNNIQEAIDKLDQPTRSVFIESKFIEVNDIDTKDLGIDWNFNGTPLGAVGYAYQYGIFEGLGAINPTGALPSTGLPQLTLGNTTATPNPNNNINNSASAATPLPTAPSRKALDLAVFNQAQYTAVLHAFQNSSGAKLVSDPTAVTMDNQEISLFSGKNITVVFPSVNNANGQSTAGNNTTYQVGITMKVKPHVTNNGMINLLLNPELSSVTPGDVDVYFNGTYPRVSTRRLTDANVSIKDGFTIAVGGLIDDQDTKLVTQVPIIGDIPIIGEFFKTNSTVHQRNNLLIFVTARTLNNDGAGYRDIVDDNMMLRTGLTADQIPGYYYNNRTSDTPGMTYPSKTEMDTMENVQKIRDQAAQLKTLQDTQQKLMEAQAVLQAQQKAGQPIPPGGNRPPSSAPSGQIRH